MKQDIASKTAYDLHTVPSRASWSERTRKFIGVLTNLDSDLDELKSILVELDAPRFDFTGSCIQANSIWIRIYDKSTTLRISIQPDIDPNEVKKYLLSQGVLQEFNSAPFSLREDYTERFSAKVFRVLVPAYDRYIRLRYKKYLQEENNPN